MINQTVEWACRHQISADLLRRQLVIQQLRRAPLLMLFVGNLTLSMLDQKIIKPLPSSHNLKRNRIAIQPMKLDLNIVARSRHLKFNQIPTKKLAPATLCEQPQSPRRHQQTSQKKNQIP